MKKAIIYLHGFNSASLDLHGDLLKTKQKLVVLNSFCQQHDIKFYTPNVDYRDYKKVINDLHKTFLDFESAGYQVIFMGSSLGGFTSEYMAIKTQRRAIMINPALKPSSLLVKYIGVTANFETKQACDWTQMHCNQYNNYEDEITLEKQSPISQLVLLDMADELLDSANTQQIYQSFAEVITFKGGSHSFEHIKQAMPAIEKVIFS